MGPRIKILGYTSMIRESQGAAPSPLFGSSGACVNAKQLVAIDGKQVHRDFFAPGPNKAFSTNESWQYVKQALESKVEQGLKSAIDAAHHSGDKQLAAKLINLGNEMLEEIRKTPTGQILGSRSGIC
jgi:hypothetical protein